MFAVFREMATVNPPNQVTQIISNTSLGSNSLLSYSKETKRVSVCLGEGVSIKYQAEAQRKRSLVMHQLATRRLISRIKWPKRLCWFQY